MPDWSPEPWSLIVDELGRDAAGDATGARVRDYLPNYARAIACVNAFAGRDPEKLAELETAIDELLGHESPNDWPWSQNCWDDLRAALAAFRLEGKP